MLDQSYVSVSELAARTLLAEQLFMESRRSVARLRARVQEQRDDLLDVMAQLAEAIAWEEQMREQMQELVLRERRSTFSYS